MRRRLTTLPFLLTVLTGTLALWVAAPAGPGRADDTTFFSSSVAPNVILALDTSGSMREAMYHPAFDVLDWPFQRADGAGVCDVIPDDMITRTPNDVTDFPDDNGDDTEIECGTYCRLVVQNDAPYSSDFVTAFESSSNDGYVERTFCGQTRKLYHDGLLQDNGNYGTWYGEQYAEWYFSLDPSDLVTTYGPNNQTAAEIIAEIEAASNGQRLIDGSTYGKFHRSRMTTTKEVAKDVMYFANSDCPPLLGDCGIFEDRIRFGIARFRGGNGGYVAAVPSDYTTSRSVLESTVDGFRPSGSTPLGETLFQLYTFFMSRTDSERPFGVDGTTRFPEYLYQLDGDYSSFGYGVPGDPIATDCQKQFIVLITDGSPTNDTFNDTGSSTQGFDDFKDKYIGDYAPDLASEIDWDQSAPPWTPTTPDKEEGTPPWQSSTGAGYLDDIALFMQDTDMRLDIDGDQRVDVYTVGFTTSGAVNVLLDKTARNGNGEFFAASQAEDLSAGLSAALQAISEKAKSFTAATVPASRATDGHNFYAAYFRPSGSSPYWQGHIKAFEFNALGEVRDAPIPPALEGDCALEDPLDPARCQVGRLKIELDGFWDAADGIPAPGSRNLYVSLNQGSPPASIPSTPGTFDTSLTTGDLDFAGLGLSIADLGDFSVVGDTTGITTDDELKDAIVRYIMGCEFASGGCIDRGDGRKLWDIFHSNPLSVGPPNSGINEASYREFVERYKYRKRVLYAGSNGGFVHGFNAGEYGTPALPDTYDRGTGEEEFGFMAWPARKTIADLPRTTSPKLYFMDGSPSAADVWLYRNPVSGSLLPQTNPQDLTSGDRWNYWRTALVGGMREGGRVVWALDVTNPPDQDDPGGEQPTGPGYPGYMWEFPCESGAPECLGTGKVPTGRSYAEYMGETWSQPVITRVRATVDCSIGCTQYDRWVAIFGAGYDPAGDPNKAQNFSTTPGLRATDTALDDYDATSDAGTSRAGRAVFMVDITTGEVLAWRRFDHDAADGNPDMRFAFTAAPAVFDVNFDGYADVVYFGDLGGNLWKWVIDSPAEDPINGSGDVEQRFDGTDGWNFFKVFSAGVCGPIEGCTTQSHYRSIFFPPQGAMIRSQLWLAFGSGERNDLDFVGTLDAQKNRYYVFHDDDPVERELPYPTYTDAGASTDFVDADSLSGSCTPPPSPAQGFYVEGEQGEKFITASEIFFGVVLTGSFTPGSSADPCEAGGESRLYGFQLLCGDGIFPDPASPGDNVRHVTVGAGLPARPRVSVGPVGDGGGGGPCADMVVVITSEGEAFSDCPGGRPDSSVKVKTWRDQPSL
jgi:hypothetical protein